MLCSGQRSTQLCILSTQACQLRIDTWAVSQRTRNTVFVADHQQLAELLQRLDAPNLLRLQRQLDQVEVLIQIRKLRQIALQEACQSGASTHQRLLHAASLQTRTCCMRMRASSNRDPPDSSGNST